MIANHALPSAVFMPKKGMRMPEMTVLPELRVNAPQRPSSVIHQPGSPCLRTAASLTRSIHWALPGMSAVRSSKRHAPSGWRVSATRRDSVLLPL